MKEIQEILTKIESLKPNEKAILATVVDVQGSSYRLPGAKMLILENGDTFGTVSGGCLEADVLERAKQVLETGEPQVFTYDTTNDQDSVFSLNMGCRGVIRILLEPAKNNKFLEFLSSCYTKRYSVHSAVVIDSNEKSNIGLRYYYHDFIGVREYKNLGFPNQILKSLNRLFESEKATLETFEFGEVFFEKISEPLKITIFGAGADAVPVAGIAKHLGWYVKIVDHREAFANKTRFHMADEIIISEPENIENNVWIGEKGIAVLMTHNYQHDKEILRVLLKSKAKYIGALGPKRRAENILKEFADEGVSYTEKELSRLYSPVGLDIGADTPEGIALSIIAEIQAVLKDREGGFLRNRKGSIYGRA